MPLHVSRELALLTKLLCANTAREVLDIIVDQLVVPTILLIFESGTTSAALELTLQIMAVNVQLQSVS